MNLIPEATYCICSRRHQDLNLVGWQIGTIVPEDNTNWLARSQPKSCAALWLVLLSRTIQGKIGKSAHLRERHKGLEGKSLIRGRWNSPSDAPPAPTAKYVGAFRPATATSTIIALYTVLSLLFRLRPPGQSLEMVW